MPTLAEAEVLAADFDEVIVGSSVGSVGSQLPRREWRINPRTGDLRGVYYVWPGKERKPAYYIGKREKPEEFRRIYPEFEAWRRTHRSLAGVGVISHSDAVETRQSQDKR